MILTKITSAHRRSQIVTSAETTFLHNSSQLRRRATTITSQSTSQDLPHIPSSFPQLTQKPSNQTSSSHLQVLTEVLTSSQRSTTSLRSNPSKKKFIIPRQPCTQRSLNTTIPHPPSTAILLHLLTFPHHLNQLM